MSMTDKDTLAFNSVATPHTSGKYIVRVPLLFCLVSQAQSYKHILNGTTEGYVLAAK
jgi:hypothetical protein